MTENQNPIKLHQLGAEIVSPNRISSIIDDGGMLPIFGIVPWKHHLVLTSKCKSIEEAFYYIARTIDEGLSKHELEDIIDSDDFAKQGTAITIASQLPAHQSQLAASVLKDPYRLDFLMLESGYNERDLEQVLEVMLRGFVATYDNTPRRLRTNELLHIDRYLAIKREACRRDGTPLSFFITPALSAEDKHTLKPVYKDTAEISK